MSSADCAIACSETCSADSYPDSLAFALEKTAAAYLHAKAAALADRFGLPLDEVLATLAGCAPPQAAPPQAAAPPAGRPAAAPQQPQPRAPAAACVHYVRGKNPHVCGRAATAGVVDGRALCPRHAKAAANKAKKARKAPSAPPAPPKGAEPNLARRVQAKKAKRLLEAPPRPPSGGAAALKLVERNGRYYDETSRICFDVTQENLAIGSLHENGRTLDPLSEEQIELLTTLNLPYKRAGARSAPAPTPVAESGDESGEELTLRSDSEYVSGGDEYASGDDE